MKIKAALAGEKVAGVCVSNTGSVATDVEAEVKANEVLDDWVPTVDLSHLDERQKDAVMKVLMEEKDVFSRSEFDIGDVKD